MKQLVVRWAHIRSFHIEISIRIFQGVFLRESLFVLQLVFLLRDSNLC